MFKQLIQKRKAKKNPSSLTAYEKRKLVRSYASSLGLCSYCAIKKATTANGFCLECQKKLPGYNYIKERRIPGYCSRCGKPQDLKGHKLCSRCTERNRQYQKKRRKVKRPRIKN